MRVCTCVYVGVYMYACVCVYLRVYMCLYVCACLYHEEYCIGRHTYILSIFLFIHRNWTSYTANFDVFTTII